MNLPIVNRTEYCSIKHVDDSSLPGNFDEMLELANDEISLLVRCESPYDKAEEYYKKAVCAQAHFYITNGISVVDDNKQLASISINGLSKSYVQTGSSEGSSSSNHISQLALRYLYSSGMAYKGVRL